MDYRFFSSGDGNDMADGVGGFMAITPEMAEHGARPAWISYLPPDSWGCGNDFSMADCPAAPSLFHADWVQEIPQSLTTLRAYRARLLARPSVARCIEAARPYRHYFPLGAPNRD